MKFADLHVHSTFSDSTYSFNEIIDIAAQNKISCLSITDHDILDVYNSDDFLNYKGDIEIIKGVEVSAEYKGKEIHLLAYFPRSINDDIFPIFDQCKKQRLVRAINIIEKLRTMNIFIDVDEFRNFVKGKIVTRMHIALFLLEKKLIKNIGEAFFKLIGEKSPAYIPQILFSVSEAVGFLKKAGGIVFVAHPKVSGIDDDLLGLVGYGIEGIEAFYPKYTRVKTESYLEFARQNNLLISGGSDCHGLAKKFGIGKVKLPYEYVEKIKNR